MTNRPPDHGRADGYGSLSGRTEAATPDLWILFLPSLRPPCRGAAAGGAVQPDTSLGRVVLRTLAGPVDLGISRARIGWVSLLKGRGIKDGGYPPTPYPLPSSPSQP